MLFRLIREGEQSTFQSYRERSASELGLVEKDLEDWMAKNLELLFGDEQVLVIYQSVSGESMPDILALDAAGRLVIVEIKRDWSDRATVGQLLEYAAKMAGSSYKDLEKQYRDYCQRLGNEPNDSGLDRFQVLTDLYECQPVHRICIVAPHSDEGLQRIVCWLKTYGVPISFVPFTLHANTENDADILLEIESLDPLPKDQEIGEEVKGCLLKALWGEIESVLKSEIPVLRDKDKDEDEDEEHSYVCANKFALSYPFGSGAVFLRVGFDQEEDGHIYFGVYCSKEEHPDEYDRLREALMDVSVDDPVSLFPGWRYIDIVDLNNSEDLKLLWKKAKRQKYAQEIAQGLKPFGEILADYQDFP